MDDIVAELEVHDGDKSVGAGEDIMPMDIGCAGGLWVDGNTVAVGVRSPSVDRSPQTVHIASATPDGRAGRTIRRGGRAGCLRNDGIVARARDNGAVHAKGDTVVARAGINFSRIVCDNGVLACAAVDGIIRAGDDAVIACARIDAAAVVTVDEVLIRRFDDIAARTAPDAVVGIEVEGILACIAVS